MQVRFKISRFDPARDKKAHWQSYTVDLEPTDRVLDGLKAIKDQHDSTLAWRFSCAHGVCGSDAMMINGRNRLACKLLVRDVKQPISVEPIRGLRRIKDLIVDMEPFFDKYRSIEPYLTNDEDPPEKERLQSSEDREKFDDTTKCILCAACTTSCPSFWSNGEYLGPAAMVGAHRFVFDSRDKGNAKRFKVLNTLTGIWRCRTVFNCIDACPREINIGKALVELKHAIAKEKSSCRC